MSSDRDDKPHAMRRRLGCGTSLRPEGRHKRRSRADVSRLATLPPGEYRRLAASGPHDRHRRPAAVRRTARRSAIRRVSRSTRVVIQMVAGPAVSIAQPLSARSSSRAGVTPYGVKQQRVCGPARPCHRPGQSTTLTIASTVVTSPSARAQWRRDPCPPRASQRDCIGIASAPTALSGSLAMGGDHCVESPARVVARVADDRRLFGRRL
jgi:hypothetical protein